VDPGKDKCVAHPKDTETLARSRQQKWQSTVREDVTDSAEAYLQYTWPTNVMITTGEAGLYVA